MSLNSISSSYAQSLFDLSKEMNVIDNTHSDMLLINKTCVENGIIKVVMDNPNIKVGNKKEILKDIFADKVQKLTMDFIILLIEKRRVIYLDIISKEFLNIYNEYNNIKVAQLIFSKETDENIKNQIITILEKQFNCKIQLDVDINPSIIGGFRLFIDGKIYDASISNQILKLRKSFAKNLYEKGF